MPIGNTILAVMAVIAFALVGRWVIDELVAIRKLLEWIKGYYIEAGTMQAEREKAAKAQWEAAQRRLIEENREWIMSTVPGMIDQAVERLVEQEEAEET